MIFFSARQLAEHVGKSQRTIRLHASKGWLKPEPKKAGVRGARFSERNARKWAAMHYPEAKF